MSSAAVAALAALVDVANALALDGVDVVDGPPPPLDGDVLAVGYSPQGESVSSQFDLDLALLAESLDVSCWVRSWSADEDLAATRARALGIVDAFAAALAADQTLGGVVADARLASVSMEQERGPNGRLTATASFTVRIFAYPTP